MQKQTLRRKIALVLASVMLATMGTPLSALAADATGGETFALTVSAGEGGEAARAGAVILTTQATAKPVIKAGGAATGKVAIKKGAAYRLGVIATKGATIACKSSAPKVASVSAKGIVKAKKVGKATIAVTATKGGAKASKKIEVTVIAAKEYRQVESIKAKASATTLRPGRTATVKTTFSPANASNKNLVYTSSNKKVAWVSASGTVTAMRPGSATITVTSAANGKAVAKVGVTVKGTGIGGYSWAQLKSIADKMAASGSKAAAIEVAKKYGIVGANGKLTGKETKVVTLTDGTKAKVRVAGFYHDTKTGGGKAGITFEFADVPATYTMCDSSWNDGGWKASKMRAWLNSTFYNKLPSALRSRIVPVRKKTNNAGEVTEKNATSVVTATSDKLWLLSLSEVYGKATKENDSVAPWSFATYNAEGTQYKLYADNGVTYVGNAVTENDYAFCKKAGADSEWWLRSPTVAYSNCFDMVHSTGMNIGGFVWNEYGVSPAFCF